MQALWNLYRLEDRQSRQDPSDRRSLAPSHINGCRIPSSVLVWAAKIGT